MVRGEREQDQERAGVLLKAYRNSIRVKFLKIGEQDDPPSEDEGQMTENPGVRLHEEVELLEDLLEKMLKYIPVSNTGCHPASVVHLRF